MNEYTYTMEQLLAVSDPADAEVIRRVCARAWVAVYQPATMHYGKTVEWLGKEMIALCPHPLNDDHTVLAYPDGKDRVPISVPDTQLSVNGRPVIWDESSRLEVDLGARQDPSDL